MKYLTQTEWERFIGAVDSDRDRAMFTVMYWRGLRASEARLITRQDIDLEHNIITIQRLKSSDGGQFDLSPDELEVLPAWLNAPRCPHRPFDLSRVRIFQLFRQYAQKAGLPAEKRHPHVLKHSIATRLLDSGLDISDVKDWLGHRNIKNTMVYAHVTNKRRSAAASKAYERKK